MEKPNRLQLQHAWYEQRRVNKGDSKVYVNQESTPYHRAYHREKLTPAQFEACKVLRKDIWRIGREVARGISWIQLSEGRVWM